MQTDRYRVSLDHRGRTITTFVVYDVAQHLGRFEEGEVLELLTDEFDAFEPDLEAWCDATGHVLLASTAEPGGHRFLIEKRAPKVNETRLAMVISSDGLEELLSPLGFALGAALEGIDVHLYFQGPAVRVLTGGFRPKLKGWARPFSRLAASGMAKAGHVSAQHKLRQIRELGGHIYVCGGSLQPFKVRREDLLFDDVPIVEYLSFVRVLEDADIQLYV